MNIEEAYEIARQYNEIKERIKLEILNLEDVLLGLQSDLTKEQNWVAVVRGKRAIQDTLTRINHIEEGRATKSK